MKRKQEKLPYYTHFENMKGMRPDFIPDLAQLSGSSLDELDATLELMPWGDRATLQAYGYLILEGNSNQIGRTVRCNESILDLIQAAVSICNMVAKQNIQVILLALTIGARQAREAG